VRLSSAATCAAILSACLLGGASQAHPQESSGDKTRRPLKVITYNVLYGFNRGKSKQAVAKWLLDQRPDVVALQELTRYKHASLRAVAAKWKHRHAALLKEDGFPVGLTSNRPITVVTRTLKGMHHGWMHCRTHELNFIVVHLSPFSYEHRLREAAAIRERVAELRADGEPVVVLGDFNAYSPGDRELLKRKPRLLERRRADEAKRKRVRNLRDGQFDYSVMKRFLGAGLEDACEGAIKRVRVDYVLLDETLAGRVASSGMPHGEKALKGASDHTPVVVTLSREPARQEPLRLRVLSYNMNHGEGTDGKIDLERIAREIDEASPDLVALQEVDRRTERSGGVDQAATLGKLTSMHVAFRSNLKFQGGHYGNAVLSRFPILSRKNHPLPNLEEGEPRGALSVTVSHPRLKRVTFVATNFDHRRSAKSRLASAESLNELTERWKQPTILAGDLNATPSSKEVRTLLRKWATATPVPLLTAPSKRPTLQKDYVLYRRPRQWRVHEVRVLDRTMSLRRPLLAVLEARPR
jgi:endonuclease/exonuclease/phosphatase family metal-dependent hydrolase